MRRMKPCPPDAFVVKPANAAVAKPANTADVSADVAAANAAAAAAWAAAAEVNTPGRAVQVDPRLTPS